MKTSTKLIIGFFSILVGLMLLTDISIWANYRKGEKNDTWLRHEPENKIYSKNPYVSVQPFKVIVVFNKNARQEVDKPQENESVNELLEKHRYDMVVLQQDSANQLLNAKNIDYHQQGDTLFVSLKKGDGMVWVKTTSIPVVISQSGSVRIQGYTGGTLQVQATAGANIELNNLKLSSFSFAGGQYNTLSFEDSDTIPEANIAMGRNSSLQLKDVYFAKKHIQLDSASAISVSGTSARMISEIK
ncbi:hypothetical protein CLV59_110178 [Chitinophaga dinghuensis]|uniref:Uncharacterized protein n=1 Tax=Chitinophaga dinghuensis TaxID=1539050 RepID=A0A327VNT4_9BACT|nr:hypothetical protein [Chitinophaga dinghuensis]RAJ75129.1 hypothetical protein CLV59_110178 [Chitinophaga dinghuensis]